MLGTQKIVDADIAGVTVSDAQLDEAVAALVEALRRLS
jgi:hypothetical protein